MKSTSAVKLLVYLWMDHPGQVTSLDFLSLENVLFFFFQPTTTPKEEGKKKKKGGGKTVSSVYLVSLGELMSTLVCHFPSLSHTSHVFLSSTAASPTLCVAWCPTPTRSPARWSPHSSCTSSLATVCLRASGSACADSPTGDSKMILGFSCSATYKNLHRMMYPGRGNLYLFTF